MWWRNFRIAAVIALAGLNAACFQPLYATRTVNGSVPLGAALAQVQVEPHPGRERHARVAACAGNRKRARFRIARRRRPDFADAQAQRADDHGAQFDHHRRGDGPRRGRNHRHRFDLTLVELSSGKTVLNGRTFTRVSSDYPGQQQRFARVRARIDAEDRAAKVIAENIRTRLASFFVAGT